MDREIKMLAQLGIIPVIKIDDAQKAAPMAKALMAGGINAAEITFRTEAAPKAIQNIAREIPEMYVCAGTVLTAAQAEMAVEMGAKAVISPGISMEVIEYCQSENVFVIPGCATPTDVQQCLSKNIRLVKLFPAEVVGGVQMLKVLAGPFGGLQFMPTGGIQPGNVSEYLSLANVAACGGSWIVPQKALDSGDYQEITRLAKEASGLVRAVRG